MQAASHVASKSETRRRPGQRHVLLVAILASAVVALVLLSLDVWWTGWFTLADVYPRLETVATVFLGIILEAIPFLLLGVVVSAAIHQHVSEATIDRLLPRHPLPAALVGSMLGIVFPVCECGVVPVSRRLLSKGAPVPLAIAFMLAGPVINPVVIGATLLAFGDTPAIAIGRFALVIVVAVAVALVFSLHPNPSSLLVSSCEMSSGHSHTHHAIEPPTGRGRKALSTLFQEAMDELFEMGRYLVIGALIASALQALIPKTELLVIGQNPALASSALMALAVLMSICSTVDAFVALSFATTFGGAAILAFLAFGPMVDLKSALMYATILRRPAVLLLVVLCAQFVFLATLFAGFYLGLG